MFFFVFTGKDLNRAQVMVVIYFKSDSRDKGLDMSIILVEEEPSVINAIKDRFIRPLKWNWLLSLSCKRECGCWPGGDGILRPWFQRFFFLLLFIGGVTAPHSISSTGAFLLRRPYSVPFSILRKRLKPKVHPNFKFSRSPEYIYILLFSLVYVKWSVSTFHQNIDWS